MESAQSGPLPDELHPGLLPDRLVALASLLAGTLLRALRSHRPGDGEGPWSLGTRYCERRIAAVARAAGEWDWLEVFDSSRRFIFTVDGFPLRVATGKNSRLKRTMRRLDADEQAAHQLPLFDSAADDSSFVWRLIVGIGAGWSRPTVTLVQAWSDSGAAHRSWPIELDLDQVNRWLEEDLAPPHQVDPLEIVWVDEDDLGRRQA